MINKKTRTIPVIRTIPVLVLFFAIQSFIIPSLIHSKYMRVYYIHTTRDMAPNTLYRFDDSIYLELPGADGILNTPIEGTRAGDDVSVLIDGGGLATGGPLMELMLAKIGASGTLHYVVETHPHGDHNIGLAGDLDGTYTIGSVYKSGSTMGSQVDIAAGALYNPVRGDVLSGPGTNLGPGWDPNVSAKVLWIANADPWGENNPNNIS
ncbi:MAG: hypothetical protein KJ967_03095, partial [Elusimicrobia bacterium]|nr:hypothetical protein [Elusimicrobiota bacterium]